MTVAWQQLALAETADEAPTQCRILHGDARALVHDLEPGSVQLAFTSPPYFGQRCYGDDPKREIGWGPLDQYLDDLGQVLDGLWRALDERGSAWFVLGDKAAGSGGAGGDHLPDGSKAWIPKYGRTETPPGIRDRQWLLAPYRFAAMAQLRGWLVRSMIVWDKTPTVSREDPRHICRPTVSTERIIMLTKQVKCRWFPDQLVEPADIWHVAPRRAPSATRHMAPFPAELPRRAILATTEPGDHVLDVFAGSGTTVDVALELGRTATGFELYQPAVTP